MLMGAPTARLEQRDVSGEAGVRGAVVSRDPIETKVLQFLERRLALNGLEPVGPTDPLTSGILDSVDMLRLANFLEVSYRIKVEDGDMLPENFDTVELIASFVQRKRSRAPHLPFLQR
jgi:acyl carrier protein